MVKDLITRLKDKLSIGQSSRSIPPPDMQIPTNKIAKDVTQPRPGGAARAHTSQPAEATRLREDDLHVDSHEPTQELLKLTDDVIDAMEAEGFDPYNTKDFTNTTSWDKPTTKR
ncbi:MAG: hypothetical protein AAF004_02980 [Pseudomonadota bacterium]